MLLLLPLVIFDRFGLQVLDVFYTAVVARRSVVGILTLYRPGLPRPNVESPVF